MYVITLSGKSIDINRIHQLVTLVYRGKFNDLTLWAKVITLSDKSSLLHYKAKIITISGSKFITLSGDVITLSGSYYIIMRFYYIIRQLLH